MRVKFAIVGYASDLDPEVVLTDELYGVLRERKPAAQHVAHDLIRISDGPLEVSFEPVE